MKTPDFVGIEKEAKQILDKFAKALESIDEEKIDFYVEREEFERTEVAEKSSDSNFKQKILKNAPSNDGDFIMAEKGAWKK